MLVVFRSDDLASDRGRVPGGATKALDGLTAAQIPHLVSIQTYANSGSTQLISEDGKSSVAVLNFSAPLQTIQNEVEEIRAALADTGLQTYVTGEPAVYADLTSIRSATCGRWRSTVCPWRWSRCIFVFGSLVSAALPVITGGLAVTVTLGAMYLIGRATSMSIFAMNSATLLGLAVAIDYALFIVWRFREELHRGASVKEAVVVTTARAGRSVFYSGAAVMVGVVGLVFFPSPGLRSLGIGGALVVFFSVVASVTFMPALMAVLGHRGQLHPGDQAAGGPREAAVEEVGPRGAASGPGSPSSSPWCSSAWSRPRPRR